MAVKDLDLDELHQAVNALMDDKGKPKKAASKPATSVAVSQPSPVAEPPKAPTPPKEDAGEQITVKRPTPSIAQNRSRVRGRTMDVIAKAPARPAPAKIKREAPSLQPTNPSIVPEPPKPVVQSSPAPSQPAEPSDDVLASLNIKESAPAQPEMLTHQKNDWPDPLDVHGFTAEDDAKVPEPPQSADAPVVSPIKPDPDDPHFEEQKDVADSPFVTTKVEKRPLGAYAALPATPVAPEPTPAPPKPEPKVDTLPEIASLPPKEFDPEVVAVESDEPSLKPQTSDETNMQDLRQMAIPQQYREAEKPANTDSRPVFDTKDYHPPIEAAHAAHRSGTSMGWVLILVFALILVGALAFAYYMVTGSLDVTKLFS